MTTIIFWISEREQDYTLGSVRHCLPSNKKTTIHKTENTEQQQQFGFIGQIKEKKRKGYFVTLASFIKMPVNSSTDAIITSK
jgi:hypothetical protein